MRFGGYVCSLVGPSSPAGPRASAARRSGRRFPGGANQVPHSSYEGDQGSWDGASGLGGADCVPALWPPLALNNNKDYGGRSVSELSGLSVGESHAGSMRGPRAGREGSSLTSPRDSAPYCWGCPGAGRTARLRRCRTSCLGSQTRRRRPGQTPGGKASERRPEPLPQAPQASPQRTAGGVNPGQRRAKTRFGVSGGTAGPAGFPTPRAGSVPESRLPGEGPPPHSHGGRRGRGASPAAGRRAGPGRSAGRTR